MPSRLDFSWCALRTRASSPRSTLSFVWLPLALLVGGAPPAAPNNAARVRHSSETIQALVNDLKRQLAIAPEVTVAIVPENRLLVSVEAMKDRERGFLLSLEESFLDELDEEDLWAVIAHELGHVWIFTNHPFLQTERQANQIAMRVVGRESLRAVYGKVWARQGHKGDLARFLGEN